MEGFHLPTLDLDAKALPAATVRVWGLHMWGSFHALHGRSFEMAKFIKEVLVNRRMPRN